ncbi:hypothetical protein [Lentibacillus sp. Marseille-P4043]|nr:hypothetical protein [Lentibacillus sp. Marseille-P4043]
MEVNNINGLIGNNNQLLNQGHFWEALFTMISNVEVGKINFLRGYQHAVRLFIFYQQGINKYVLIEINPYINQTNGYILTFDQLQQWFRGVNNIDGQSNSKGLGAARNTNIDSYVNGLLQSIYNDNQFQDDNGLVLTKNLLNGDTTKGFDLDLFQYIPSTNEYVIYEFLKRENHHINNIQAHPMRYCWTGSSSDNKQKYISLWNTKQQLNGRLFLINYSDNPNEKISVIEVLSLDTARGITSENKYCISRSIFLGWLHDMKNYNSNNRDYFSDFKGIHYNQEFFGNFNENKRNYGSEFSNIFI